MSEIKKYSKQMLENLVLNGYHERTITRFGFSWTLKALNNNERELVFSSVKIYKDKLVKQNHLKLNVLYVALIKINDISIDNYDNDYLDKLPQSVIDYLYDEFLLIDSEQIEMIDDTSGIKDLVHDNLLRIKYMVMKATNALPTEQRVKDMNIYQWLWYYYNLVEDKNEKEKDEKLKIDYLAMFINPQLSKQIKDERDAQNQQGIINNNNVKTTTEHTEVNPNNPNEITIYKDTNVDKDFDAKIQAVIGASDDKFTVLPDDVVKGNVAESKQDFIQKVIQNAQLEEQENKK